MLRLFICLSLMAVVVSMTTDSARASAYYYGAIIVFSYEDNETNENVTIGSVSDEDEVGKYGYHSPVLSVSGPVVRAMDSLGLKDGCDCRYETHPHGVWVALVERGNCTFTKKIETAMKNNASAVIVYDDVSTEDVTLMSHEGASTIPAIMTSRALGNEVDDKISSGESIRVVIRPGERHRQEMTNLLEKASIVFVSISFMILMVISLAWLIFYYVQRFRLIQNQHRGQQLQYVTTKKAIAKIPVKTLKVEDKEVAQEQTCIICLDRYKCGDSLRIIECSHSFHRKCIDPWLQNKQTCPMCKFDVVKGQAATTSSTLLSPPLTNAEGTNDNDYEVINEVESPSSSAERPHINLVVVTTLQNPQEEEDEETKTELSEVSV